jgi:hypothetical protein
MIDQGQMKFYKSKGALQAKICPPSFNDRGFLEKEGGIFLDLAPGISPDPKNPAWDWNQKITFMVSVTDLMKLENTPTSYFMSEDSLIFENTPEIVWDVFHQYEGEPKKLLVKKGANSGYMLSVSLGKGDTRRSVTVPLTDGEFKIFRSAMLTMVPYLIGWLQ